MAEEDLKGDQVAAALAKKTVREPVAEAVRGDWRDPGSPAQAPDHPAERLRRGGTFRVEPASDTLDT
jgi:hypothetical protein